MYSPTSVSRISTAAAAATVLLALGVGSGAAFALDAPTDPVEITVIDTSEGKALADKNGNALYTWAGDEKDKSNCTGDCAKNWPAATGYPTKSSDVTGDTNQIDLAGSDKKQVVLDEKPLYYFKDDAKPGDTKGNGVKGADGKVWSLVGPDGKALGAGAAAAATTPEASESPSASASASDSASESASASASASAAPSESASTGTGAGTAKPVAPVAPGDATKPAMPKATPSGAVKAGAEVGSSDGAARLALGFGGAAVVAAGGTVYAVRRRNARQH
jgi:predicted lipoprotein with Yx(FWY)xxD motif